MDKLEKARAIIARVIIATGVAIIGFAGLAIPAQAASKSCSGAANGGSTYRLKHGSQSTIVIQGRRYKSTDYDKKPVVIAKTENDDESGDAHWMSVEMLKQSGQDSWSRQGYDSGKFKDFAGCVRSSGTGNFKIVYRGKPNDDDGDNTVYTRTVKFTIK